MEAAERKYAGAADSRVAVPERPGALDDLERALTDQASAIDRLVTKLTPLIDPHGGELVMIDEDVPERSRIRALVAALGENTERLRRLTAELDV